MSAEDKTAERRMRQALVFSICVVFSAVSVVGGIVLLAVSAIKSLIGG